jgi:hypothetical protein
MLAQPWPRTILLVGVVEGAAGFGALAIWASHLHLARGFSLSAAGGIVALFGFGGVCYMATARHLIRRLRQPQLVTLGVGLVLVAALDRSGAIGRGNALPWKLPDDLQRFKALTLGKPLVMGRR